MVKILLLSILCFQVLADVSITNSARDQLTSDFQARSDSVGVYDLYVSGDSGDSESDAIEVFVGYELATSVASPGAVTDTSNIQNFAFTLNGKEGTAADIYFPVVLNLTGTSTDFSGGDNPELHIEVSHNEDSDQYFYVAYKNSSSDYEILDSAPFFVISSGDRDYLEIPWQDFCNDAETDCGINEKDSLEETEDMTLYIFTDDTAGLTGGKDPSDHPGGVYVKVNFSSLKPGSPNLSSIKVGDQQLTLDFNATGVGGNMSDDTLLYTQVVSFDATSGPSASDSTLREALAVNSTFSQQDSASLSGEIVEKGLSNDQSYYLGVMVVNKYQVASLVSDVSEQTPIELDVFIQEQSCYLISAGFGKKHPTLDYFRMIRDQHLLKNSAGQWFVKHYYRTAPHYVKWIEKSPKVKWMIQKSSQALHQLFQLFIPDKTSRP